MPIVLAPQTNPFIQGAAANLAGYMSARNRVQQQINEALMDDRHRQEAIAAQIANREDIQAFQQQTAEQGQAQQYDQYLQQRYRLPGGRAQLQQAAMAAGMSESDYLNQLEEQARQSEIDLIGRKSEAQQGPITAGYNARQSYLYDLRAKERGLEERAAQLGLERFNSPQKTAQLQELYNKLEGDIWPALADPDLEESDRAAYEQREGDILDQVEKLQRMGWRVKEEGPPPFQVSVGGETYAVNEGAPIEIPGYGLAEIITNKKTGERKLAVHKPVKDPAAEIELKKQEFELRKREAEQKHNLKLMEINAKIEGLQLTALGKAKGERAMTLIKSAAAAAKSRAELLKARATEDGTISQSEFDEIVISTKNIMDSAIAEAEAGEPVNAAYDLNKSEELLDFYSGRKAIDGKKYDATYNTAEQTAGQNQERDAAADSYLAHVARKYPGGKMPPEVQNRAGLARLIQIQNQYPNFASAPPEIQQEAAQIRSRLKSVGY